MLRRGFLLAASVLALGGCARAMDVGSSAPSTTYSLMVENRTSTTLVVSYSDGRSDATLGTVAPGRSERFVIAGSVSPSITVRGTTTGTAQPRTIGPVAVTLEAGRTSTVVLR